MRFWISLNFGWSLSDTSCNRTASLVVMMIPVRARRLKKKTHNKLHEEEKTENDLCIDLINNPNITSNRCDNPIRITLNINKWMRNKSKQDQEGIIWGHSMKGAEWKSGILTVNHERWMEKKMDPCPPSTEHLLKHSATAMLLIQWDLKVCFPLFLLSSTQLSVL